MTDNQQLGLRKVRRALISVSDKTGIIELANALKQFDVEILSTGGTARALRDAGIEVRDVSEVTGFPEMMDGRVKTLHPKIHGGLLAIRDNPAHQAAMAEQGIEAIDLVVINLYPFEQTIARHGVTLEEAVEQIDIGGPALIRSAAKNFKDVAVVTSSHLYDGIAKEMSEHEGALTSETRQKLSAFAYTATFIYDATISNYLSDLAFDDETERRGPSEGWPASEEWPATVSFFMDKDSDLRYGENPHQKAALYCIPEDAGIASAELLSGKEMSFNNYVDADAAWQLVSDFDQLACAIIKHTNPAGVGVAESAAEAYRQALETDPVSAFGGIVAFNCEVDVAAAKAVVGIFTEVVVAPSYESKALKVLKTKKNLRVLQVPASDAQEEVAYRQISGGMLLQTRDIRELTREDLKVVSKRQPTAEEIEALLFAWTVCKHTKSNAIVYARAGQTVGVGAGQMSRIDSVKLGAMRAQIPIAGSVLASDAFFPFRDGIDEAAKHGITAVIQPGGSMRDAEVIAAADEHGLAMVMTGIRHFKH
ncbi:MAG: bifunctional phosphoribosylaminoimidazolecarboxamide formyltransferase/IMP cyclohydrolase [Acidobacteriota bacterium]|nr:bifunctional phosphoribosylaminoimidazolecarboxamide formyltransferase/IMP cyclohydrolase [Acidobacteriota bacterium]